MGYENIRDPLMKLYFGTEYKVPTLIFGYAKRLHPVSRVKHLAALTGPPSVPVQKVLADNCGSVPAQKSIL